jgi:ATP-binding cassette subfamily B (MDR/TAP) protein 1
MTLLCTNMHKGKVIEEGTHESLLSNPDGAYWALVNAQQLSMNDTFPEEKENKIQSSGALVRVQSEGSGVLSDKEVTETYKPKSFFGSFGLLIYEQRSQWPW